MKKIKILFGLEAVGGGAIKHLVYLASRLDKQKFDIKVILSRSRGEDISSELQKLKLSGVDFSFLSMQREINLFNDLKNILLIYHFIKNKKFDIVHAHSSKAGAIFRIAARVAKVPSIYYTPHCFYFKGKSGIVKKCFVLIERLLARITTGIIVSENERLDIIKNRVAKPAKIININNAIDFNEYNHNVENLNIKGKYGIKKDQFVIGAIGRLSKQKDWDTYLLAAKQVLKTHPKTVFLIVGSGELYDDIKMKIQNQNLIGKVILTNYVKQINEIYEIIDVFVNTSLWEGLPYVILEAMSYKKPIILTNTGNNKIVTHNENGFVTPKKDYKSIAAYIKHLMENKYLNSQMGELSFQKLNRNFSFELFIKHHESLYLK